MEKNIQDYAKYYIGCKCLNTWFQANHEMYNNDWVLDGYREHVPKPYLLGNAETETWTDSIKPILRRLGDMTMEEAKYLLEFKEAEVILNIRKTDKYYNIEYKWADERFDKGYGFSERAIGFNPDEWKTWQFHYLLKQGFDIFGLIESGLAIDASTLTK